MAGVVQRFSHAGLASQEVSIGGGWAVAYRPGDVNLSPTDVVAALAPCFSSIAGVRPAVEPGRALVAQAAVAVYRVGAVKRGPTGRIVAVDGGMGDNPRPALYDARYTAFLPASPFAPPIGKADVVGRYCEEGDVLVRGLDLPEVAVGDLVCVPVSGAYQLSMASSYNLVPPPASVLVDGRDARLMTRRATIDDMLSREVSYSNLQV
jgi:diaminopimelate decarboxylase